MNEEIATKTTTTHGAEDENIVDQIFGKHPEHARLPDTLTTEESVSAADQENTGSLYQDEVDENDANSDGQQRYLYSTWGAWSTCTRSCGQRTYAFRKRYCIEVATGELKRHCQRPTILVKKCAVKPCPSKL